MALEGWNGEGETKTVSWPHCWLFLSHEPRERLSACLLWWWVGGGWGDNWKAETWAGQQDGFQLPQQLCGQPCWPPLRLGSLSLEQRETYTPYLPAGLAQIRRSTAGRKGQVHGNAGPTLLNVMSRESRTLNQKECLK